MLHRPIHILNGPNLNRLGLREPQIYGHTTLAGVEEMCRKAAPEAEILFRQTNAEHDLVNWIHDAIDAEAAIIINPAGLTFRSIPVMDALKMVQAPVIELHISNIHRREAIYHSSLVSGVVTAVIAGLGPMGYRTAVEAIIRLVEAEGPRGPIRLGLIGDNIGASRAPLLHRLAGRQNGREVDYDRLVPGETGQDFDALFADVAAGGYLGINVTYPYKERAAAMVSITDPLVQAIGAVNTVLFRPEGPQGFNTDYSGFIRAYEQARGVMKPGPVLMIGAGGVGRAIAFALLRLGVADLRIADTDQARAERLCADLRQASPAMVAVAGTDATAMTGGATGFINCTPVGMVGKDGTVLDATLMAGGDWAFDAVYTPVNTRFLREAQAAGLSVISGYELFIGQGVDAWALFTGLPLDEGALRRALEDAS